MYYAAVEEPIESAIQWYKTSQNWNLDQPSIPFLYEPNLDF